jgi:hypothetical protein
MRFAGFVLFTFFALCNTIAFSQKQKILLIGPVSDFPLTTTQSYDYAIGAEASLIKSGKKRAKMILSFSYAQYTISNIYSYSNPLNAKTTKRYAARLTAGALIQGSKTFFFCIKGGLGSVEGILAGGGVAPILMAGPTFILPLNSKCCIKLNAEVGVFRVPFISVGVSFGYKL